MGAVVWSWTMAPACEYTTNQHDQENHMSEKPGADDTATDTDKPTPEQAHNRLIGRLLAGEDPDPGEGQE